MITHKVPMLFLIVVFSFMHLPDYENQIKKVSEKIKSENIHHIKDSSLMGVPILTAIKTLALFSL